MAIFIKSFYLFCPFPYSWRLSLFLAPPFHANRAPEKVLLAKVFWEEERQRSDFLLFCLLKSN